MSKNTEKTGVVFKRRLVFFLTVGLGIFKFWNQQPLDKGFLSYMFEF